MSKRCRLELSNGETFIGELIGAPLRATGELVFTTGMVGYSEAITDPSYFGQILVFTYPLIGNYGIPEGSPESEMLPFGFESDAPHPSAVILCVDSPEAFHWNSFQTLDRWLKDHGIPGITGLDTRHLVHLTRSIKGLLGKVVPDEFEGDRKQISSAPLSKGDFFDPAECQVIDQVSTREVRRFGDTSSSLHVGVIDCGIKANIIRQLVSLGVRVSLLPWDYDFSKADVDGWLVSNGPGDPYQTGDLVDRVRQLLSGHKPVMGICLGHQILSLAAGGSTSRMVYGHRSHNQPVYEIGKRRGYMTTQNHGFVVSTEGLSEDWEPWFMNANDHTNEGIRHKYKPFFGIQFHPEACGGPRDTSWIFDKFVAAIKEVKA